MHGLKYFARTKVQKKYTKAYCTYIGLLVGFVVLERGLGWVYFFYFFLRGGIVPNIKENISELLVL